VARFAWDLRTEVYGHTNRFVQGASSSRGGDHRRKGAGCGTGVGQIQRVRRGGAFYFGSRRVWGRDVATYHAWVATSEVNVPAVGRWVMSLPDTVRASRDSCGPFMGGRQARRGARNNCQTQTCRHLVNDGGSTGGHEGRWKTPRSLQEWANGLIHAELAAGNTRWDLWKGHHTLNPLEGGEE